MDVAVVRDLLVQSLSIAKNDSKAVAMPTVTLEAKADGAVLLTDPAARAQFFHAVEIELAFTLDIQKEDVTVLDIRRVSAPIRRILLGGASASANLEPVEFDFRVNHENATVVLDSLILQLADNTSSMWNLSVLGTINGSAPPKFSLMCQAGRWLQGSICSNCAAGKYTDDGLQCKRCADTSMVPNTLNDACTCPRDTYLLENGVGIQAVACLGPGTRWTADTDVLTSAPHSSCVSCEGEAYDCVHCLGGQAPPIPRPGYATVDSIADQKGMLTIFSCQGSGGTTESACLGGNASNCAEGSTGPLCRVCEPGYKAGADFGCVLCPIDAEAGQAAFWAIGLLVLVSSFLLFLAYIARHQNSMSFEESGMTSAELPNPMNELQNTAKESSVETSDLDKTAAYLQYMRSAHLVVRVNVQTVRIVIGFGQVVGQLGSVLHVKYPEHIATLLNQVKEIFAFGVFDDLDCVGISGFYPMWTLNVVGIPLVSAFVCLAIYSWGRCRNADATKVKQQLWANAFTAIFLIYPSVCQWTFSTFACRKLSKDTEVLAADYSIKCDFDSLEYLACFFASVVVAVVFALGVPIATGLLVYRKAKQIKRAEVPAEAAAVAAELGLASTAEAIELIQDVKLGEDYGFLLNAFRPSCYKWELVSQRSSVKSLTTLFYPVSVPENSVC